MIVGCEEGIRGCVYKLSKPYIGCNALLPSGCCYPANQVADERGRDMWTDRHLHMSLSLNTLLSQHT